MVFELSWLGRFDTEKLTVKVPQIMALTGDSAEYNFDRMDELEVGAYLKSKGVPDEHVEKFEGSRLASRCFQLYNKF